MLIFAKGLKTKMTTISFEHERDNTSEKAFEEISEAFTDMPDSLKSFYVSDVLGKRVKGVSVVNAWQIATNYFNSFPHTEQGIEDSTVKHILMPDFVSSLNINLSLETAHNFINAAHVVIESGDSAAKTLLAEILRRHFN